MCFWLYVHVKKIEGYSLLVVALMVSDSNESNIPSEAPVVYLTITATLPNKDDDLRIRTTLGQQILIEWEVWMCPQKTASYPSSRNGSIDCQLSLEVVIFDGL